MKYSNIWIQTFLSKFFDSSVNELNWHLLKPLVDYKSENYTFFIKPNPSFSPYSFVVNPLNDKRELLKYYYEKSIYYLNFIGITFNETIINQIKEKGLFIELAGVVTTKAYYILHEISSMQGCEISISFIVRKIKRDFDTLDQKILDLYHFPINSIDPLYTFEPTLNSRKFHRYAEKNAAQTIKILSLHYPFSKVEIEKYSSILLVGVNNLSSLKSYSIEKDVGLYFNNNIQWESFDKSDNFYPLSFDLYLDLFQNADLSSDKLAKTKLVQAHFYRVDYSVNVYKLSVNPFISLLKLASHGTLVNPSIWRNNLESYLDRNWVISFLNNRL